jgi:hypothetical protein
MDCQARGMEYAFECPCHRATQVMNPARLPVIYRLLPECRSAFVRLPRSLIKFYAKMNLSHIARQNLDADIYERNDRGCHPWL